MPGSAPGRAHVDPNAARHARRRAPLTEDWQSTPAIFRSPQQQIVGPLQRRRYAELRVAHCVPQAPSKTERSRALRQPTLRGKIVVKSSAVPAGASHARPFRPAPRR